MTFPENKQIELTVVVAAWNRVSYLYDCLLSLEKQVADGETEVVVVSNFEAEISESEIRFPFARHIFLSVESTVPQLRAYGIFQSQGKIVALAEDFCTFDAEWCEEIKKAHELSYAVGGAVENLSQSKALDWAVFFFDYGKFMPPVRSGVSDSLSGANVSYKREILKQRQADYEQGFFESFFNEDLKRCGYELYLSSSAVVYHNKTYKLNKVARQFFHQARSFAARRVAESFRSKRISFAAASLILPLLLTFRVVSQTIERKGRFRQMIISLPYLMILMSIWAFGEFCGYLIGAGTSNRQWR